MLLTFSATNENIVNMWTFFTTLVIAFSAFLNFSYASNKVPSLRMKFGHMVTSFSAGDIFIDETLGSLITLQPTVTWSFPNFRARLGVHLTLDILSDFGLTPLSGIGVNGYIYPWGISTSHEKKTDGSIFQKSKSGPFFFTAFTPVNFNINADSSETTSGNIPDSFSSVIYDVTLGLGFDYALKRNTVISSEVNYRFGNAATDSQGLNGINYSAIGLMFSILTSYY